MQTVKNGAQVNFYPNQFFMLWKRFISFSIIQNLSIEVNMDNCNRDVITLLGDLISEP